MEEADVTCFSGCLRVNTISGILGGTPCAVDKGSRTNELIRRFRLNRVLAVKLRT